MFKDFKNLNVKSDPFAGKKQTVVPLDAEKARTATEYRPRQLTPLGDGTYAKTKSKYGSLAATDPDHARSPARGERERSFALNPLLREPLGIENEENRVIEARVQARLKELMAEAMVEARVEGFEAGRQQGFDEAFAQFKQDGETRMKRLDQLLGELESAKAEIFQANERFVMNLVFRVARMILLKELATDKDYLLRLTRELIERVGVRENIRIRIHPDEMETVNSLREGLDRHFGGLKNLHIESSSEVTEGGCLLETQWNAIDATIERQLAAIQGALVGESDSLVPGTAGGASGESK